MAYAGVCSKAVALLLSIHCLLLLPVFMGVLCFVLVLLFNTLCHSSVAITLVEKTELVSLL